MEDSSTFQSPRPSASGSTVRFQYSFFSNPTEFSSDACKPQDVISCLSLSYSPVYVLCNDVMWFIDRQFLPEKYVSTNDEVEYISTSLLRPHTVLMSCIMKFLQFTSCLFSVLLFFCLWVYFYNSDEFLHQSLNMIISNFQSIRVKSLLQKPNKFQDSATATPAESPASSASLQPPILHPITTTVPPSTITQSSPSITTTSESSIASALGAAPTRTQPSRKQSLEAGFFSLKLIYFYVRWNTV